MITPNNTWTGARGVDFQASRREGSAVFFRRYCGRVGSSLVFVLLALTLAGCADETPSVKTGQPAPPFELPRLNGTSLAIPGDLEGHIVAVRFWADWCPFCENEMGSIEPIYRTYRDQGLAFLAVNVRQDRMTAARFVERLGVSYDVLLDREGAVARRYGVIGLPTTFFIDREGRIATRIIGESTPELFEQIVRGLL